MSLWPEFGRAGGRRGKSQGGKPAAHNNSIMAGCPGAFNRSDSETTGVLLPSASVGNASDKPVSPAARSGKRRIDDDVAGNLERALIGVAFALDAGMALESAADVVLINDGPVAVDSHPLELREIGATPRGFGVLHFR
jgi:hypothetical protein